MKKLQKLFSKHLIFTASALVLVISAGFVLSSRNGTPEVSATGMSNTQVLAYIPSTSVPQDACKGLEGALKEMCQQAVRQAVNNPTKNVTVCRKFFGWSLFCHTEKVSIPVETSVCQSILATENALLQQAFGGEADCELRLQNLKPTPTPMPTPIVSPTPTVVAPTPVAITSPAAGAFSLPSYPGALQVVGLGKNPFINGSIYFSLFYSIGKPSSYPVSRFLLSLGDTFLQISGRVTAAENFRDKITFSGSVDTTKGLIHCTMYISDRDLSCTLRSGNEGIQGFAIQKLPDVSFYYNTLFTSVKSVETN